MTSVQYLVRQSKTMAEQTGIEPLSGGVCQKALYLGEALKGGKGV
jgi:hypothetical protein